MQNRYTSRAEAMLAHIGLYRLTLRVVLDELFFDGRSCANVVQRLIEQGRIVSRKGLGRAMSYYQLTLPEARRRSLPQDRGCPLGPRAIATHLAVLWFSCMQQAQRRRLEETDISKALGDVPSGCPHVAESAPTKRIYRVHVVSPSTRVPDMLKRLHREIRRADDHPELAKWLTARRYVFCLLTDPGRVEAVRVGIQNAVRKGRLPQQPPIICDGVPSPITIQEVVHAHRGRTTFDRNE
jgi:hypothetical protein